MKNSVERAVWWSLCVVLVLSVFGCQGNRTSDRSIEFVSVEETEALSGTRTSIFGKKSQGVCIDPRAEFEYRKGHIPGAIHVPYEDVRSRQQELRSYDTIVVYGTEYGSTIAQAMSKTLIELGFNDVRTLRGGLRAWEATGRKVDEGDG